MKSTLILFFSALLIIILSCVKPLSTEQNKDYNSLKYQNPNTRICSNQSIKKINLVDKKEQTIIQEQDEQGGTVYIPSIGFEYIQ